MRKKYRDDSTEARIGRDVRKIMNGQDIEKGDPFPSDSLDEQRQNRRLTKAMIREQKTASLRTRLLKADSSQTKPIRQRSLRLIQLRRRK